jgi:hypothetical protein
MDAYLVILVVGVIAVAIAYYAIREDQQNKEIEKLVKNAIDRDGDGVILEGTPFERKVAKPVKKAAAKKKTTSAKAKPKAKVKPKAKKAPAKKKAVAKKKSK